jgi:type III restriction enzyme
MEAFFDGLGEGAVELLSANLGRAGPRLVRLVAEEQRSYMAAPSYERVVELRAFAPTRATDRPVSGDRHGAERLVAEWGCPTRPTSRHQVRARAA